MKQIGGVIYNTAEELWKQEGIKPESSVNDLVLKLEKEKIEKKQSPYITQFEKPIPRPSTSKIESTEIQTQTEQSPYITTSSQTETVKPKPEYKSEYIQTHRPIETKSIEVTPIIRENIYYRSPILYDDLYRYAIDYIPYYYRYDIKKRLEDAIKNLILSGLSKHKSEYEIKMLLKTLIDNASHEEGITTPKVTRKPSIKKKPSRKKKTTKKKTSQKKKSTKTKATQKKKKPMKK